MRYGAMMLWVQQQFKFPGEYYLSEEDKVKLIRALLDAEVDKDSWSITSEEWICELFLIPKSELSRNTVYAKIYEALRLYGWA